MTNLKTKFITFLSSKVSTTNPWGYILTVLLNWTWDKFIEPFFEQLKIEGHIFVDKIKFDKIVKEIQDAKTPDQRRDAFDRLFK